MTINREGRGLAHSAVAKKWYSTPGLRPRHRPAGVEVEDEVVVIAAPQHQYHTTSSTIRTTTTPSRHRSNKQRQHHANTNTPP
jgi:hypothetical protein